MTYDDHIQTLLRGDRGGFAAKLAEAWCHADGGNRAAIKKAFPHIFNPEAAAMEILASCSMVNALWWFIENVGDDDPNREAMFFHLRERMNNRES